MEQKEAMIWQFHQILGRNCWLENEGSKIGRRGAFDRWETDSLLRVIILTFQLIIYDLGCGFWGVWDQKQKPWPRISGSVQTPDSHKKHIHNYVLPVKSDYFYACLHNTVKSAF